MATESRPTPLETKRADDGTIIPIMRALPLYWLLTVLAAFFGLAATIYFSVQRQGELIQAMTVEVKQLTTAVSQSSIKDAEHDFRLADHERRLQAIEQARKQ